jgi:4-hydroxybenzoate polyprenyltransferase
MTSSAPSPSAQPESPGSDSKLQGLWRLMRFHKPIGTWLLAAPTTWALIIASEGWPDLKILCIFGLGIVIMRAAGCVANDLADRKLDGHVARTRDRPLVTGLVSTKEALVLLLLLLSIALALVLLTNALTVKLSLVGVALAMMYPYMKRVTHLPQFVLGAAFSWSIPMAFAAVTNTLPEALWWLFLGNLLWTVVYDTQYAMVDREDDLAIGIKSTAILFGHLDRRLIAIMQIGALACFLQTGAAFGLTWPFYAAVLCIALLFCWHQWLIRHRQEEACFKAFNQSKWIGLFMLLGIVGHFLAEHVSPI